MKHNGELTPLAQRLRREMTKEERKLWYDFLHTYPYRFRRQVAFGNYILDFYCSAAQLAIELDGSQHFHTDQMLYDAKRSAFFEERGIRVIRFINTDVTRNFRSVTEQIDLEVQQRISKNRPLPSASQTPPFRQGG